MKVALLLSGGVDSSVALDLLLKDGHEVDCYYLKIWLEDELSFLGNCPWEEDMENVHAVCSSYGVNLKVISLQKQYHDLVVEDVLQDLRKGYTPSPDIWCNERIKFGAFFDALKEKFDTYDRVASGHYANVEYMDGLYYLTTAKDKVKDQTYFLSRLNQKQLSKLMFPIGNYLKSEVRQMARNLNLYNKDRKDSQGICFLGKIRYRDFVRYHLGEKKGNIINQENGEILGKHKGTWFYTIGQRQGLSLSGGPWFVSQKDIHSNSVYITHGDGEIAGNKNYFYVRDIHWISKKSQDKSFKMKIRHSPYYVDGIIEDVSEEYKKVTLLEQDNGIAGGQSVIFYKGNRCLGSAMIELKIGVSTSVQDVCY